MNQEQNNLNPNNFNTQVNTQGNNGILNNQTLNNQSFNQQSINPQPQPTPSFQQPIIQESTPQPMNNIFESGNANNQNLNSKPSKKMNLGLVIGIVVAVIVIAIVGVFLLNKNNSNGSSNSLFGSNTKKITKEDINNYNLKSLARWGNINLGISYSIPTSTDTALFSTKGSKSFSYLHGHSFEYSNDFYIYVEKSLDGNKNLETLPIDINTEKNSEKYKYGFPDKAYDLNEITSTEKIIIGDIETVYFESNESDTRVLSGISMVDAKARYLGYSFKYEGAYYSVYGKIGYTSEENDNEKKEMLKKYLHYIINSFKKYNKESFYELDNNFNLKSLLDSGEVNKKYEELTGNERQFIINLYGTHMSNGQYGEYGLGIHNLLALDKTLLNWDGSLDNIYNSVINNNSYTHYLEFIDMCERDGITSVCTWSKADILEEASEKINGIEMKKYIIKHEFLGGSRINYFVVYAFVVDNNPYLFQYALNYYYESSDGLTDEQQNMIKDVTDIVGSTLIRTIRFIEFDSNSDEYINKYKYRDYIN